MVGSGNTKRNLRQALVRLHRYLGLFLALFLIVSGLSGSMIAFDHELDAWLNPDLFKIREQPTALLSLDRLAEKVRQAYPGAQVTALAVKRKPGESVRVSITLKDDQRPINEVYINPFTGQILGARERGAFLMDRQHVVPMVYRLHSNLYLPDRWGVWLLGVVALIWMVDCFVGFYLTLPPAIRRPALLANKSRLANKARLSNKSKSARKSWLLRWKPSWSIKTGASKQRLNFDIHRASGLWFWPVLFVLAMSGVSFNLNAEIFRPVVGFFGDLTPDPRKTLPKVKQSSNNPKLSFSEAVPYASALLPERAQHMELSFVMYIPKLNVYRVAFDAKGRGEKAFLVKSEQLFIDANTGELKGRRGYDSGTNADKFLALQFPMHSGQILGLFGRVLISIAGVLTAILSVTGVVIWLSKLKRLSSKVAGQH